MEQAGKEELFLGKKRNLDLKDFNISEYAYKELQYFCMQYGEKKKMIEEGYGPSGIRIKLTPRGSGVSDPTFETADRIIKIKNDIEMIENAAKETDGILYKYIIRNVSEGTPFEVLEVPCGRRQFYDKRKIFFNKLYRKKNEKI